MQKQHIYTVDISDAIERFRLHHQHYANPEVLPQGQAAYIHMLVEQMLAHFEIEITAVQSFIEHYAKLITDPTVSPRFMYHPLAFLKKMDGDGYQSYLYCLYGFAEEMFRLLLSHGMYTQNGVLRASYEHIENDTLYLVVRPEVSNVFLS